MFIDDERFPPDTAGRAWVICRTIDEVRATISQSGFPRYISFDHDLGDGQASGKDIANWMIEADMDGTVSIPADFDFYVHSQNPVGSRNIESLLRSYLLHRPCPS